MGGLGGGGVHDDELHTKALSWHPWPQQTPRLSSSSSHRRIRRDSHSKFAWASVTDAPSKLPVIGVLKFCGLMFSVQIESWHVSGMASPSSARLQHLIAAVESAGTHCACAKLKGQPSTMTPNTGSGA